MRMAWLAVPVIGAAIGMGALAWSDQAGPSRPTDTYNQLGLFATVLAKVEKEYVDKDKVDDPKTMQAAINGMLASLDPHSSYMSPEELRDSQSQMRGEYSGLGIEVTAEDGLIKVVSPIDDTPASRAGIHVGDYITHINGNPIIGLTLNEAVALMRGDAGTPIQITVAREGSEPLDVSLTREVITVSPVKWHLEGDVGVVRISTFNNERTASTLESALADLKKKAPGGLKGIVLDLRNNPGGLLDQANLVADDFLDGGEITSTRGRDPNDIQRYNAHRGEVLPGVPMIVLVNGGSASASEIVAGALQDRRRAVLLGTTSFGKGSVQTVIPLNNGRDGALRLTTARYYTPAGRSIQGTGIDPDLEVAQTRTDDAKLRRLGLSEADLPNALANPNGAKRGVHEIKEQPPENWDKDGDFQMKRALEVLRDQAKYAEILRSKSAG